MSGEKKYWRLPTPFRKFPGKQDLGPKARSGSVSTVYLSNDISASGLIVVPEFDDLQTQATHEHPRHASHPSKLPESSSSSSFGNFVHDHEPMAFQRSPYLGRGLSNALVADTSSDVELSQRLDFAYKHIRSMPPAASQNVALSSDPQMLRKQLGVPQHSVLNYPIHSPPDLPNPHAVPRYTTPHRLSPTASPDESHTKIPRKPGARIDTNVYPTSSRVSGPPDPSRSAHVYAPKSQLSATNPYKPLRRGAEDLHSCLPSSRRQTSRNFSRETDFDTLPSTNADRRQTSIQVRPPSPFTVDIPLHHTWHDRRTDFESTPEYYSKIIQSRETESRRTSESTEVLASLAWIGTSSMTSRSYTVDQQGHPAFLPDSFGMAVAVEDDSISDDVLVDRLEKVRRSNNPFERRAATLPSTNPDNAHFSGIGEDENWITACLSSSPSNNQLGDMIRPPSPLIRKETTSDSEDAEVWHAVRRTLLCIREIVRTEKKYQEALKMLLNAQTTTPPPSSMVPYISSLVRVSEMLLKGLLGDPSAWGVSTAFVTSEDDLETTMVSWCAVAGAFFTNGDDPQSSGLMGRWRLRKSGVMSSPFPSTTKQISISPQLPPMFPTTSVANKTKERVDEEYGVRQYPQPEQERHVIPISSQKPESTESQAATGRPPGRKLSVRDLAIQPIQRVMRYVLLYRDLLDCTPPTSPSRLLVERALEAATRIANQCDKAQRNPAFFHTS